MSLREKMAMWRSLQVAILTVAVVLAGPTIVKAQSELYKTTHDALTLAGVGGSTDDGRGFYGGVLGVTYNGVLDLAAGYTHLPDGRGADAYSVSGALHLGGTSRYRHPLQFAAIAGYSREEFAVNSRHHNFGEFNVVSLGGVVYSHIRISPITSFTPAIAARAVMVEGETESLVSFDPALSFRLGENANEIIFVRGTASVVSGDFTGSSTVQFGIVFLLEQAEHSRH